MKSRVNHRVDQVMRALPYVLSVSAMTFAVACGGGNGRQNVVVQPPRAGQQKTVSEEQKLAKLFPQATLSNAEDLGLAQRIEGGAAEVELIDEASKNYGVLVSFLIRSLTEGAPAIQVHLEGEISADLQDAIRKASTQKDKEAVAELFKRSYLKLNEANSSAEAKGVYHVQSFCLENDCRSLAVRLIEVYKAKTESADEAPAYRQVALTFVRGEDDVMRISSFFDGGSGKAKDLTKKTFAEAATVREKDGSISPAAPAKENNEQPKLELEEVPVAAPKT